MSSSTFWDFASPSSSLEPSRYSCFGDEINEGLDYDDAETGKRIESCRDPSKTIYQILIEEMSHVLFKCKDGKNDL